MLDQVAVRSGIQGTAHNDGIAMHAEDEHRRRRCCPKPPDEVQSGKLIAGDAEVEDDDVGVEAVDHADGFGGSGRLGRRAKTSVLDELTTALGHYRMIVDYENLGHRPTRTHQPGGRITDGCLNLQAKGYF